MEMVACIAMMMKQRKLSLDELNFPEHWYLTHQALHVKILSVTKYLQKI